MQGNIPLSSKSFLNKLLFITYPLSVLSKLTNKNKSMNKIFTYIKNNNYLLKNPRLI